MHLKLQIKGAADLPLPDERVAGEAAARGLEVLVRRHLRRKNSSAQPRAGFPKTDYYADAAETVTGTFSGKTACVEVDKEGIALHYEGGTVYPKKKALAIPIDPSVAGIWPSEYGGYSTGGDYDDGATSVFWPKGSSHGFIKENETGELLWLLVPHAKIPADKTVLPEDGDLLGAAEDAIWEACA